MTFQAKTLIILQWQYLHHWNQLQVGELPQKVIQVVKMGGNMGAWVLVVD